MPLSKAIDDLRESTLAALPGLWAKLAYFARLRRKEPQRYSHWGFEKKYGTAAEPALEQAHHSVYRQVLHAPLPEILEDIESNQVDPGGFAGKEAEAMIPIGADKQSAPHFRYIVAAMKELCATRKDR